MNNKSNFVKFGPYGIIAIVIIIAAAVYMNPAATKPKVLDGLYFSNIGSGDEAFFRTLLEQGDIPAQDIDNTLALIRQYNSQFDNILAAKDGFLKTDKLAISYDEVSAFNIWYNFSGNRYSDVNCRVALFTMARDMISGDEYDGNSVNLMFDYSCMDNYPVKTVDDSDRAKFTALFAVMNPPETDSQQELADFAVNEWHNRGLEFKDKNGISLINVFFHDLSFGELFIGHCGLLVEVDNGFVFIEKIAPSLPFQMSTFSKKADLVAYLDEKYAMRYEEGGAKPFYMENMKLFEAQ